MVSSTSLKEFFVQLRCKVRDSFKNNPSLVYIQSSEHTVTDTSIDFNVKILESFKSKPLASDQGGNQKNPFLPPFEEGQYISDILTNHRLIFNKFSVCDQHVLVITKDFENQLDLLNHKDFKAALLTCKALDAMMFFNCGINSGASIKHKHMQVIPYESFQGGILPVEEIALQHLKSDSPIFQIHQFSNFKHAFCSLKHNRFDYSVECDTEEQLDEQTNILETCYKQTLTQLGYFEEEHQDYNLILTRNFLFIVLRQCEGVSQSDELGGARITVNSLGFAGTIAIKNLESLDYLKGITPLKVLELISKPISHK